MSPIAPHGRDHGPAAGDEEAGGEAEHEAQRLAAGVEEDLRVGPPVAVDVHDTAARRHHRNLRLETAGFIRRRKAERTVVAPRPCLSLASRVYCATWDRAGAT